MLHMPARVNKQSVFIKCKIWIYQQLKATEHLHVYMYVRVNGLAGFSLTQCCELYSCCSQSYLCTCTIWVHTIYTCTYMYHTTCVCSFIERPGLHACISVCTCIFNSQCSCRRSKASFLPAYHRTSGHVLVEASLRSKTCPWRSHLPSLPEDSENTQIVLYLIFLNHWDS